MNTSRHQPATSHETTINGFAIRATTGGARSQNPRKYQDDADVLERALATETDPFLISRYTFYLAQSYKDCGEKEKALANYMKRAELGFWNEEIYVTLLEAGNLMAALDRPFDEVIAAWERATQIVPTRAEALHAASRYCRNKGKNAEGMEFARRGIDLMQPNGLFVQPWVYDYGILDEFAVNAYWAGAYRESLDASLKLLASDKLPPSMVKRIAANARFAADKMPASEPPNLGTLGAEDLVTQHTLVPQRLLRSRVKDSPRVMVAILAKQKELALPLYLDCIEALDYPKSSIVLYIRTNNNTDKTEKILRDWVARVGPLYHSVEFDASDVADRVEQNGEHEWNATRSSVLGRIRNQSLRRARELGCDFYFVVDVDNFIRPATLRELVALDLPIAAPLLRSIAPGRFYSNYHAEIDANGYYENCDQYLWILSRYVRGVLEVPVVHCTYLVRTDVIPELTYEDASRRHEYVVFSDSARKAGIPQYFDNRQVYGYITFGPDDEQHVSGGIEQARALLRDAGDAPILTVGDQQCKRLETSTETAVSSRMAFPEPHQDKDAGHRMTAPFPEVLVINLDDRKDRWVTIEKTCTAANLTPIRMSAIRKSPGWQGCGLSHLECIRFAKERDLPWVLILEDDATFTPEDIRRFRGLLGYLWENRAKWERFNGGPTFPPDPVIRILTRQPPLMYANGFCTHFYLVHSGAYDTILKWDPTRDPVIDVFFMNLANSFPFKSIATVPHISVQATSLSDVTPGLNQGDYSTYFRYSEMKLRECLEK